MNIVLWGFPGTGKTTLARRIEKELNYNYTSDYLVCNHKKIEKATVVEFLKTHDGYVMDINYSVPVDVLILNNCKVYCFGFIDIEKEILFDKMKSKGMDITIEQVEEFLNKSMELQQECKKHNISFIKINSNRDQILERVFKTLSK